MNAPDAPGDWKLFFATDLHGSEHCFKKFLSAARVYEVSALFLGGDLVGKELILLRKGITGRYEAWGGSSIIQLSTQAEVQLFIQQCADRGAYTAEVSRTDTLTEGDLDTLLVRKACERLQNWMSLAQERLAARSIPLIVIPGNDDPHDIDPLLHGDAVLNADQRLLTLPDGTQVLGLGCSTPTPWHTVREWFEQQIAAHLKALLAKADAKRRLILNIHVPPYGYGLDHAPVLDADFRPRIEAGGVPVIPVGSRAVAEAVLRHQPTLGLFGHVHEARGYAFLGRTLCVNPGSDFGHGRLLGLLAILRGPTVVDWILTEG